jgi:hypothetical protein
MPHYGAHETKNQRRRIFDHFILTADDRVMRMVFNPALRQLKSQR